MDIENNTKNCIAKFFKIDVNKINNETIASDIKGWDSLAHTDLLLHIEKEFNIDFELGELMNMDNVGSLISIIKCKF